MTIHPTHPHSTKKLLQITGNLLVADLSTCLIDTIRFEPLESGFVAACGFLGHEGSTGTCYKDRKDPEFHGRENKFRNEFAQITADLPRSCAPSPRSRRILDIPIRRRNLP